jgi:hypothetical protein
LPATTKRSSAPKAGVQPLCKRKNQSAARKTGQRRAAAEWIRELASPYLKGYNPVPVSTDGLEGYWFLADGVAPKQSGTQHASGNAKSRSEVGFFVGYLQENSAKYSFLRPEPPECLIFASVSPVASDLHRELVREPGSLVRKTFEYIRWLTHRPPRFVFHENEEAAMARHASMKDWPAAKREHLSRNFFIETLCWLVRSGLVRKLREEAAEMSERS